MNRAKLYSKAFAQQRKNMSKVKSVTWAYLPQGMWDLPGPGMKPMSPSLADRFLTTGPWGKSLNPCFN